MEEQQIEQQQQQIQPQRAEQYLNLISKLLQCPNGQEPEVLDQHLDLIDVGFVSMLMQVATQFAHENNPDGAKFLIFLARELSKQLGLYPDVSTADAPAQ